MLNNKTTEGQVQSKANHEYARVEQKRYFRIGDMVSFVKETVGLIIQENWAMSQNNTRFGGMSSWLNSQVFYGPDQDDWIMQN